MTTAPSSAPEVSTAPPALPETLAELFLAAAREGCAHVVLSVRAERAEAIGKNPAGKAVLLGIGTSETARTLLTAFEHGAGLPTVRPEFPVAGGLTIEVGGEPRRVEGCLVPTRGGIDVAMEVTEVDHTRPALDDLGLLAGDLARLRALLAAPSGLFVVAGDAGHGKSTTFAAIVDSLAGARPRVLSVSRATVIARPEVTEIRLPECPVRPEEEWVEAALRLRPEVVAFDDLSGREAPVRAVRAALGGAFVVYALRNADVVEAARFLESLPLLRGTIAAALLGILAVRLVRRSCPRCTTESPLPIELGAAVALLDGPKDGRYTHGQGCAACNHVGSRGVTPLYELCSLDDESRQRLVLSRHEDDLPRFLGRARPDSIRAQAVRLAARGEIPVSELVRVL